MSFQSVLPLFVEKEYGTLYYMDGNHAVIYPGKITDLGNTLNDIASFYRNKGIRCTVYHPFVKDYFKERIDTLKEHGFTYTAKMITVL